MFLSQSFDIWLFVIICREVLAERQAMPRRVTAEYGSDLSLSCTFHNGESDETIVQWLYQNRTENIHRRSKTHWRPLFLNAQSLTFKETRYSIQQKIHQINETFIAYSTMLTLAKVTDSDEGLYMCKSLSPTTIQMMYQVRVIQSLDITPKRIFIPSNEVGLYSIQLDCILKDNHIYRRHPEISWWHNNRRLGSQTNRYARITKNLTQHSLISSLFYTGEPANLLGNYICESQPLRRYVSVQQLQRNTSSGFFRSWYGLLIAWICIWIFHC